MKRSIRQVILLAILLLPLLVACATRGGQLKPLAPGGEGDVILAGQPQLVTFSQLQTDPEAFQNRLIRVSGTLLKASPPACVPYSGPAIEWALIAEELRLDAVGFERAVSMLDDSLPMTVDGFFRLYEGALGCGKAAPDGSAWYLEVIQIVQPNPLIASGLPQGGLITLSGTPVGSGASSGGIGGPAGQAPPGNETPGATPATTPTGLTSPIPTSTTVVLPGTGTATSIPTASSMPSATSRFTLTPTRTPLPGTTTITPTPTRASTIVPGSTPTPTPTVDQYPGPGTPTPTPTSQGYPSPPSVTPSYP
jgi:hypothetical protein